MATTGSLYICLSVNFRYTSIHPRKLILSRNCRRKIMTKRTKLKLKSTASQTEMPPDTRSKKWTDYPKT